MPRSTGVQTKFLKTRTVEISSDLLQSLNEYRVSERRLKRVTRLNEKIEQLQSDAVSFTQKTIEILERCDRHEPLLLANKVILLRVNPLKLDGLSSGQK